MTRIVAGRVKGRRLAVPAHGTRPTSERAREALFNTLDTLLELPGAAVLDLFAGSGAIGLEALSRGAERVDFVENDRQAAQVLRGNLALVALPGGHVYQMAAATFLATTAPAPATAPAPYDLAFCDPPYALDEQQVAALLAALCTPRWLAPGAVVVLERAARGPQPGWPPGWDVIKHKRYGEGALWYGRAL